MELMTINWSKNKQKEELFEILQDSEQKIVMVSYEWLQSFSERPDVWKDELSYKIFDDNMNSKNILGMMKFEKIQGVYFLKSCDFLGYPSLSDIEVDTIVYFK